MDQVFAVKQVCEKFLANGKDGFWAFMDLENSYNKMDFGHSWIWKIPIIRLQMPRVYGVGGKLLKAVLSFYLVCIDSRACVRIGMYVGEYCWIEIGLHESP